MAMWRGPSGRPAHSAAAVKDLPPLYPLLIIEIGIKLDELYPRALIRRINTLTRSHTHTDARACRRCQHGMAEHTRRVHYENNSSSVCFVVVVFFVFFSHLRGGGGVAVPSRHNLLGLDTTTTLGGDSVLDLDQTPLPFTRTPLCE